MKHITLYNDNIHQNSNRKRWRLHAHDLHQVRLWTALVLGLPGGVDQGVYGQSLVWVIYYYIVQLRLQVVFYIYYILKDDQSYFLCENSMCFFKPDVMINIQLDKDDKNVFSSCEHFLCVPVDSSVVQSDVCIQCSCT